MAENSKIEWTDHTFNPWMGCTKVGPGCDHCYAEAMMDHRYGKVRWGAGQPRQRTSKANWRKPLAWNKAANGSRPRVFCASLADVFDNAVPKEWRADLWDLIDATPNLDWLLLTKRIGNVRQMIPDRWSISLPPNVWLGATVVNQEEADRDIPKLLSIKAHVRFLSCEPLLGPIGFEQIIDGCVIDMLGGAWVPDFDPPVSWAEVGIDWVIVGGESGTNARPMVQQWCLDIARQCRGAGTAFFMKQGSQANWSHWKEFDRWHDELRVRQLPTGGRGDE